MSAKGGKFDFNDIKMEVMKKVDLVKRRINSAGDIMDLWPEKIAPKVIKEDFKKFMDNSMELVDMVFKKLI